MDGQAPIRQPKRQPSTELGTSDNFHQGQSISDVVPDFRSDWLWAKCQETGFFFFKIFSHFWGFPF